MSTTTVTSVCRTTPIAVPSSSRCRTMLDLLAQQAAARGASDAYIYLADDGPQQQISYAALEERAQAIAAQLQRRLSPGDRALLVYPAGLEFVTAFFGCLYAGVVAVPATYPKPRRPLPRMNRIAIDCGAHLALTTSQTLDTIDFEQIDPEVGHLDWIATDTIESAAAHDWNEPKVNPDDLAFLQYTSGSTSDPKGVMVSHGNLLSNLAAIQQAFGIGEVDADHIASTGVFWLPAYHDMGLIGGVLTPLYVGGRSVLMSPNSFLARPLRWLEAIHEFKATISGAPNFAYDLCAQRTTPEERAQLDLSLWRLAFCGAEPIRAATIRNFTEAFAEAGFRPSSLYPCYGLAESTLLATGPAYGQEPTITAFDRAALAAHQATPAGNPSADQVQEQVGCGAVVAEHELMVVDPATNRPVGDGRVGEILLRGPSVAKGYWNRPQESKQTFAATSPGRDGHYLRTGDLGFIHQGQLFVTGRVKDVIIIRGRNHYPQDIEQTVEGVHPGLMPGAAFAVPVEGEERLVVVHQVDRQYRKEDWAEVTKQIRRAVVARHELDPYAVVLIRQTSLPITSSGKVQRNLCREQYLQGELKLVHQWTSKLSSANGSRLVDRNGATSNNGKPRRVAQQHFDGLSADRATERVETWLMQWLVERVGLEPADIDRHKPFAEFGVDSLAAVELSQELEDQFGVPLTPVVAWNHPTPAAISRYIAEQATGQPKRERTNGTGPAGTHGPHQGRTNGAPRQDDLSSLLAEIENLTDEQAAQLLAED